MAWLTRRLSFAPPTTLRSTKLETSSGLVIRAATDQRISRVVPTKKNAPRPDLGRTP